MRIKWEKNTEKNDQPSRGMYFNLRVHVYLLWEWRFFAFG